MGTVTRTPADITEQTRQKARQGLRDRATHAETHARNRLDEIRKGTGYRARAVRLVDTPDLPALLERLNAHPCTPGYDGYPPPFTRKFAARLKQLNDMRKAHGPLVLIRVTLSELDMMTLKSARLRAAAVLLLDEKLTRLLLPGTRYTQAIQRAANTHSHVIVPLAHLLAEHADLVRAAPIGPGGGVVLLGGQAHGVIIRDTERDFEKVARYTSRDPVSALYGRDYAFRAYLEAVEAELQRLQGDPTPTRLAWSGTTPSKGINSPTIGR